MLAGVGACGAVAYIFYRSMEVFLVILPLSLLCPVCQKKVLAKRRKETLGIQFKDGITLLASSLSAGYSVENALGASVKELKLVYGPESMMAGEFSYMAHQVSVNRTVESLFVEFADRSGLEDVRQFAETFAVAKRSGGELAAIMEHTASVMAGKMRVREEILNMTAEKRFEQRLMNFLPFLIILYIDLTSPGFFAVMYGTAAGRAVMTGCLAAYIGALFAAEWILKIEV